MPTILRQRRDTAANWSSANPVVPDGQLCFDTTNDTFRIGDGTSNYSSLPVQSGVAGEMSGANNLSEVVSAPTARANLGLVIGTTVQAYDSTIMVDADIGSTVQAYDSTIMVDADIGSTVQAYYATGYESLPILKSANYTAVAGDTILVTSGSITITLPASPSAGDTVIVKDGTGTADTTNWTVGRNGSNIASSATDLTFDKNWVELCMTYINATIGWSV